MNALSRQAKVAYVVLALAVIVGVVLRIVHLDSQGFWADEAFSWDRSTRPLPEMMAALVADYASPPLHYLFLGGWLRVVGSSSFAARLFAALFGIACLPAIYWLGRELYDRTTATIAVILLAVSELAIAYSQEVRPYSQFMFFTIMTAALYLHALARRSGAAFFGAIVCAILALGTHYYAALTIVALAIWHLRYARDRVPLSWIVLGLVLGIVAYLPWLLARVADGAIQMPKVVRAVSPTWFDVTWDTPFENLAAFGNARLDSLVSDAVRPWAVIIASALFCAPVLFMLRRRWEQGALAMGVVVAFGAVGESWKWALVGAVLVIACRWIGGLEDPRRRLLANAVFLAIILSAALLAHSRYVPYFFVFLVGLLIASPLRQWLPIVDTASDGWKAAAFLGLLVAVPMVALLIAGTRGLQYDVRYVLAALAPFYVLVAHSIASITKPGLRFAWIAAIVASSTAGIHTVYAVPYKENFRDALAFLHEGYRTGECVVFAPRPAVPRQWHLYRYDDVTLRNMDEHELATDGSSCTGIWLLTNERVGHNAARGRAIEKELLQQRGIVDTRHYHWVRVVHFGASK